MATITDLNIGEYSATVDALFFDIPFGQSQFEVEKFTINAQLTAERAYRTIGVRIRQRIHDYMVAKFTKAREQVDIDELTVAVDDPNTPPFTLRRAQIDVEEKTFNITELNKEMNDALIEINFLNEHLERLPEFEREEFEQAEPSYHNERLNRDFFRGADVTKEIASLKQRNPAIDRRRNGTTASSTGGNRN